MLDPSLELADLHIHVGGAVAPHILWSIAHDQGFKLPVQTYWEFRDLVTARAETVSSLGGLPGDPAPLDGEDSVVAGGHRALGLRDHRQGVPLQRRDADRAALQPDEAEPGRRARPGPHHPRGPARHGSRLPGVRRARRADLLPGARVPAGAERDHREEGDQVPEPRRGGHRSGRARVAHAGAGRTRWTGYRDLFARARAAALGTTVHTGETADTAAPGVLAVLEKLAPSAHRPRHRRGRAARRRCEAGRESGTVLEICPSSNLRTHAVADLAELGTALRTFEDAGVRFTINTDGPYLLNTHLRSEYQMLHRARRSCRDAEAERASPSPTARRSSASRSRAQRECSGYCSLGRGATDAVDATFAPRDGRTRLALWWPRSAVFGALPAARDARGGARSVRVGARRPARVERGRQAASRFGLRIAARGDRRGRRRVRRRQPPGAVAGRAAAGARSPGVRACSARPACSTSRRRGRNDQRRARCWRGRGADPRRERR